MLVAAILCAFRDQWAWFPYQCLSLFVLHCRWGGCSSARLYRSCGATNDFFIRRRWEVLDDGPSSCCSLWVDCHYLLLFCESTAFVCSCSSDRSPYQHYRLPKEPQTRFVFHRRSPIWFKNFDLQLSSDHALARKSNSSLYYFPKNCQVSVPTTSCQRITDLQIRCCAPP